ncbi:hypothetical protein [Spirosoma sp. KNUC1025]|uniref:hypothetical protein n=1 Tax=Spirosoma sp. KNUC1025 TaxID=2894082 RepID=UPI003865D20E|nr:hypothetical protein LN737_00135 [Spirosoma sp. KNUC1025]
MKIQLNLPLPGTYIYSYPTFLDSPQRICIHGFTPDSTYAFVSYPNHPNRKPPQAIKVSWFKTVTLKKLNDWSVISKQLCLN